ncbi:4-oxalocrotonate tautomerase family protein [candidate division WOR-3 bacterium]|nr:4-oxalocrotonate tautomerase family protein [candidate division WOR-3 bacterium]
MPYVEIKVAGKLDDNQKKLIAGGVSKILEDVAKKPQNATYIVFQEIERDNWAVGSKMLSES